MMEKFFWYGEMCFNFDVIYLQKITGQDIIKAYNTPDQFTHSTV